MQVLFTTFKQFFTTYLWLVLDLFTTYSQVFHILFRTCIRLKTFDDANSKDDKDEECLRWYMTKSVGSLLLLYVRCKVCNTMYGSIHTDHDTLVYYAGNMSPTLPFCHLQDRFYLQHHPNMLFLWKLYLWSSAGAGHEWGKGGPRWQKYSFQNLGRNKLLNKTSDTRLNYNEVTT